MSILADRVTQLKPSPTLALSSKAKAMKKAGEDVINMSVGEPDFDTPDYAKDGARKAIDAGETKYTAVDGIPELKSAVIEKFKTDNDLVYEADQVVVGVGAKQILFNCLLATVNPGDEVISPAPYWVSYPSMTMIAGGNPVIVETDEADDFLLSPKALEQAITPKTKWLVLNSPSNPTGALYSKDNLEALADVLRKHPHVHVISDDIYEYLNYSGEEYYTLAQVAPDLFDRVVTVNGVSKAYAMTGWRIGYAGGPTEIMRAIAKIQSQSTSNATSIAQYAALAALEGPEESITQMRDIFKKRRDLFVEEINKIDGLSVKTPKGAFYAYINISGAIGTTTPDGTAIDSDIAFADYLLENYKVATVPGSAFGLSPYVRASYALGEETLQQAAKRISEAVQSLGVSARASA